MLILQKLFDTAKCNKKYQPFIDIPIMEEPLDLSLPKLLNKNSCNDDIQPKMKLNKNILFCDYCAKGFDRPSLLKRHLRTHTGEKPHVCETCKKGFSTSSSLNTHRRIHSGLKPHVCGECGKCFTASSNLYYHKMTHTKVKPHKCDLCPKSFPTPGDLRTHKYVHSGSWPYRCTVCYRGFSKQTNLNNHIVIHSGDKRHMCNICGKRFAMPCNLKAHIKLHGHNKEENFEMKNSTYKRSTISIPDTLEYAEAIFRQNLFNSCLNFKFTNFLPPFQQKFVIHVEK